MRSVYEASHSLDAHMIVHLLEQHGIHAHIQGEYLQGGVGDLPAGGLVRVLVQEDDLDLARKVVEDWERRNPPDTTSAQPQPFMQGRSALLLATGAALGGIVVWSLYRGAADPRVGDHNRDGRVDERITYDGSRISRVETDRNFDGAWDAVIEFDAVGARRTGQFDNNFDGVFEQAVRYERNQVARSEWDRDQDGFREYRERYDFGVIVEAQYWDPQTSLIEKRVMYRHGVPHLVQVDRDLDGHMDVQYRFDAIGEPLMDGIVE